MPTRGVPAHWQRDVPLSRLTTWRIGGPARFLAAPSDLAQFCEDLRIARRAGLPVLAIGGGSNLLVSDAGYSGLLLRTPPGGPAESGRFAAGTPLATAARHSARSGLRGLEWAQGIPGTIGGAIVNNAGAYGSAISKSLRRIDVVNRDGRRETWDAGRLGFGYRTSILKGEAPTTHFLISAEFEFSAADPSILAAEMKAIEAQRRAKLPREPSCGCVFRNPPGEVAGRLIDQVGLKGRRCGDALVSPRHANFIVNAGAARAEDVLDLIRIIRATVQRETGIALELEVQLIGWADS